MATTLASVIATLESLGVFRFALPFLVTFAVVYGLLDRIDLFEEPTIDAIIAVVAGFFVAQFALTTAGLGIYLSNFFGAFAVVMVFLLGVLLAAGVAGGEDMEGWERVQKAAMYLGGLAVVAIFLSWGGLQVVAPEGLDLDAAFLSSTDLVTLVVVLAAIGIIYVIVSE